MNNSMTTSNQLIRLCKKFGIPLNEICSKDQLHNFIPSGGGYIVNMQDSDEGHGTHWVAIWIPPWKNECIYFDSFGIAPPIAVMEFCARWSNNLTCSTKEIQNINGGHCGQYCVHFLYYMSHSPQKKNVDETFRQFLSNYQDTN